MNIKEVAGIRKEWAALRKEAPLLRAKIEALRLVCAEAQSYIEARRPQTSAVAIAMHKAVLEQLAKAQEVRDADPV